MIRLRYAAVICIIILLAIVTFTVFSKESEISRCILFLSEYGWETENEPNDFSDVNIPYEFDNVYKNYNIIQNDAGLDLTPYRGMKGVRYTFLVKNYPYDVGENVYANVLCVDGNPVAGDIMTVSLRGFMHSLKYPEEN